MRYTARMSKYNPEYHREWRRKNPEKARAAQRRYKKRNPDSGVNSHLRRKYGITLDEYKFMLEQQENKCSICKRLPEDTRRLDVDHDHITGEIRGLLCLACNSSLGGFKDDINLLKAAIIYLGGDANV